MDARQATAGDANFPWLQAVDDEDAAPRLSARKMLAAIAVVLLAAAIVAGTLFWLGRAGADGGSGPPELIRAEPGPYKIKPPEPGGLDVAGESGTAYATSAGEETDAELDLGAVPEEPVARPQTGQPAPAENAAAKRLPGNETRAPVEEPAAPAGPPGSAVQLGFYPSQSAANAAWETLSGRFSAVAGAGKIVVPYQGGFRLRAGFGSPAQATRACQLLKVAGEACFVVR
jgi:hypothetical protein